VLAGAGDAGGVRRRRRRQRDVGEAAAVPTPDELLAPPVSCAFDCDPTCEPTGGYQCPALADWGTIGHAAGCGSWDGKTTPTVVAGKCVASAPSGEALKYAGVDKDDASQFVLPTGYRAKPAGKRAVFADYKGQFPTNVIPVPGSELVVVIDGGIEQQSVRLVDTTQVAAGGTAFVVGEQPFNGNDSVNYGAVIATTTSGPMRLWVSGSAGSVIYAFDVDATAKTLTPKSSENISIATTAGGSLGGGGLSGGYYLSGLAISPDQKTLWAGTMNSHAGQTPVFAIDVDPSSASYRSVKQAVPVDGGEIFTLTFHPADPAGQFLYVSVWDKASVDVIDTTTNKVVASYATGKSPEAFAPIGPRYLAVVSADQDEVSILDTLPSGGRKVSSVSLQTPDGLDGSSPSGAWYEAVDATHGKLFVTLAGFNAVAELDATIPSDGSAPTFTSASFAGTDWWPTAVTATSSGNLVVVNGKGWGTGAEDPSTGSITGQMRGSIQVISPSDLATAEADTAGFARRTNPSSQPGVPTVDCGGGADDFPIPLTNTEGPSKQIKHVVFVVKENKTFDAVFGDLAGVEGAPGDVMAPGMMDVVFVNQRAIARGFTNFDNYYTSAEQSLQGHIWTTFGRTTEYVERTWLVTWGRGFRTVPTQGLTASTSPYEGSLFSWLDKNAIDYDDMGELVGNLTGGTDPNYPGLVYAMSKPDTEKTCYASARARASCDLKSFTYMVTPNDHTAGGSAGQPSPQTYIAEGDEGTGILIDGLSHSPFWASTLVIVTEDDPQDGGDHIDAHRTPLYMASPWIKRGYVSKTHIDVSSVHKILAHVFGKPYPNEAVARAVIPFDAFSATPDYSSWDHIPRKQPLACNPRTGAFATAAAMSGWDLSQPDHAPGLSRQVWEMVHGTPAPAGYGDGDGDD
jgi:YVTN family beta-propeller protein